MGWFSSVSHEFSVSLHWARAAAAPAQIKISLLFSLAALVRSSAGVNICAHCSDAADLHKQVIWFQAVLLLYENGFGELACFVNVWAEFIQILVCFRQVDSFKSVFILFLRRMLCLFFLYYLKAALKKQIVHWDGFSGAFVLFLTEWFSASIKV